MYKQNFPLLKLTNLRFSFDFRSLSKMYKWFDLFRFLFFGSSKINLAQPFVYRFSDCYWFLSSYVLHAVSVYKNQSNIRLSALGKFKTRALGGSNLRTRWKNLRTASAQYFKAKNQFLDESIVDGPQKRSKRLNYTALRSCNLDD